MTLVSPSQSNPGDEITAGAINTPVNQIAAVVNGNIDDNNIASMSGSKLSAGTVPTAAMADNAINYQKVAAGAVVQYVYTKTSTVATGTTLIPYDNTIPQSTEGDQYMSLSITPKSATNILEIRVVAVLNGSAGGNVAGALFQDSTANALVTATQASSAWQPMTLVYQMVAGTTSATTFKFRAGGQLAGTVTFNGTGGTAYFGGTFTSGMTIAEIKA